MQARVIQVSCERLIYRSHGFIEAIECAIRKSKIFIDQDAVGFHSQGIDARREVFVLSQVQVDVTQFVRGVASVSTRAPCS